MKHILHKAGKVSDMGMMAIMTVVIVLLAIIIIEVQQSGLDVSQQLTGAAHSITQ